MPTLQHMPNGVSCDFMNMIIVHYFLVHQRGRNCLTRHLPIPTVSHLKNQMGRYNNYANVGLLLNLSLSLSLSLLLTPSHSSQWW